MNPGDISAAIGAMADFILDYALALAAVGTLSMALIEAAKSIFRIREKYHYNELLSWMGDDRQAWAELMALTTAQVAPLPATRKPWVGTRFEIDYQMALFTLDLEKMMGQIQAAADVVLDNPREYPRLYAFLTREANHAEEWMARAQRPLPSDATEAKAIADMYAQLNKYVRRRLDSFQLRTGFRWSSANQRYALILGAALMFVSLCYLESLEAKPDLSLLNLVKLAIASLIGGVVAPVAKDLVVALKQVRSGG